MGSFCERCGSYECIYTCRCVEFDIESDDGDHCKIYALSEDDAASRYVEQINSDYSLVNEEVTVKVNDNYYSVSVEPEINYIATKQSNNES